MRRFFVHVDPGSYDFRRLRNFVQGSGEGWYCDERRYGPQDLGALVTGHDEVECDPSRLGKLLVMISRMDPRFVSGNPDRSRRRRSSGLEVTFRVDDHGRFSREDLGNAIANISLIDPKYKIHHWPRRD